MPLTLNKGDLDALGSVMTENAGNPRG